LLLFLWIVADTMMLALMARSSGRPGWPAVLGVMAGTSVTVLLGLPSALRETLWATAVILVGMAVVVLGHIAWGAVRAKQALATPQGYAGDRWTAAVSELLPPALVRLALAELTIIHMALFRWGGPADVPANARAFAYHKQLAPMCAMLLILSAVEMAVYHLLVGQWSRTAALIMFVLSDVGFIYLVGLIKSFRFRPILLTPEGIHVRAGILMDHFIPFEMILAVETNFSGETVRDRGTLNAALLAWPNILVRLRERRPRRSALNKKGPITSIAFRLDEPEPFLRLLQWRMGQPSG
ncbi:MAG TPA: hypothetical protein VF637_13445, partial [Sphingomicrobium sp.]